MFPYLFTSRETALAPRTQERFEKMKYKILIVDDEPANLRALERLFRDEHEVLTAASGVEALASL